MIHMGKRCLTVLFVATFSLLFKTYASTTTEHSFSETTLFSESSSEGATGGSDAGGGEFDLGQPSSRSNTLGAYFGYSSIGGENYIGFRFQPDLQIGKLGVGLDIPLQFNVENYKLRTEEYKDGVGLLRMIRFLSWGVKKQDKVYVKVGDLTGSYLGYGMLISNYSNSISMEKRKMGLDMDLSFGKFWGIEVLYSDLNIKSLNLLGIRPYVKPLAFTGIPIIKTFDIGVQYVTDRDKTGGMIAGDASSSHNLFVGSSGVTAEALDMGFTLLNMPMVRMTVFGSVARLEKNTSTALKDSLSTILATATPEYKDAAQGYKEGYGASVGMDLNVKVLGNLFRLNARTERLWYSNYFIPHFFDVSYEMNKDARILSAVTAKKQKGFYGELGITVLDKITAGGGVLLPDNLGQSNPAMMRLTLDGNKLSNSILLEGQYVKGGLTTFNDVFTLDERSLATIRAAYKVAGMLFVGMDYNWTWANVNGTFKPVSYVSPYVGFRFDLPFLNK